MPGGWTVFDHTPSPLAVAGPDGRLLRANAALANLVGRPEDQLAGIDLLARADPERATALRERAGALPPGEALRVVEGMRHGTGRQIWLRADISAIDPPGGERLLLLSVSDVTPASQEPADVHGDRDGLTGLPGAGRLDAEIGRTLAEVRRHGRSACLVLLGFDDLGGWTAAHGPQAVDRLLRFVAATTSARVRAEDLVARAEPDVFGVLLRDASRADARRVADELVALVAEHGATEGRTVGAAAGVLALDERLDGAQAALRGAQVALAAARHGGDGLQDEGEAALLDGLEEAALAPSVKGTLRAVRELLGMDVSYVTRHTAHEQVFVEFDGDDSFGVQAGSRLPLEATYCDRALAGELPSLLPHVRSHPVAGAMPVTASAGVGAFATVPVRLSDGSLYGTLCAASHDPRPGLADRDLKFLNVLARMVASELERDAALDQQLWLRVQAAGAGALLSAVEARDRATGAHSREVVDLAEAVGRQLGLEGADLHDVTQVALLHDIGKLSVPDAILRKPSGLDPDELEVMRRHPADGARIVAAIPELAHLAPAIRAEHERWDGGGYPDGLANEAIPLASRIAFVCDAYHAMTNDRPYRRRMVREDAVRELSEGAGGQFCPMCVDALFVVLAHDRPPAHRQPDHG